PASTCVLTLAQSRPDDAFGEDRLPQGRKPHAQNAFRVYWNYPFHRNGAFSTLSGARLAMAQLYGECLPVLPAPLSSVKVGADLIFAGLPTLSNRSPSAG